MERKSEKNHPAPTEQALPEEVNIVYDKIFIPTKNEPGGEYPSAVCDFDDDEQRWEPGDCLVKAISGPVAFMPASLYHKMQSDAERGLATISRRSEEMIRLRKELSTANALIKEKQQWIDSHI